MGTFFHSSSLPGIKTNLHIKFLDETQHHKQYYE